MNRLNLELRVRAVTRDFSNSIFRQQDILDFINEAIDRCVEVVPQFSRMTYLVADTDVPSLLPSQYHNLLALYASSKCFFQDERFYQATTLMNEFETKLEELHAKIQAGDVTILDGTGVAVADTTTADYVTNIYFKNVDDEPDDDDFDYPF